MQQDLSGVFLLLMVIALVLLGYILRRLSKQGGGKSPQSRGGPVPNEHPARTAAAKPREVEEFDAVSVHRRSLLSAHL